MASNSTTIELCPELQHPFTCIVSGMTQSGKSKWIHNLLTFKPSRIVSPPENTIYCYTEYQKELFSSYGSNSKIKFHKGMPNESDLDKWFSSNSSSNNLLILDDLMQEIDTGSGSLISSLFTRGSHHRNLSIILVTQNLFHQNRHFRTISLNASYLVVFKNPRDASQIDHLARQMYPGRADTLHMAYRKATERPHGYLLIDLKQSTPEEARLRTNIFDESGEDAECEVFVPI
jgi:hypothetical protein